MLIVFKVIVIQIHYNFEVLETSLKYLMKFNF